MIDAGTIPPAEHGHNLQGTAIPQETTGGAQSSERDFQANGEQQQDHANFGESFPWMQIRNEVPPMKDPQRFR